MIDDAAGLAWVVNLGCIDLNPHPVRAEDLDHPDELRVDLDPVPGVPWSDIREVALATKEALDAVGLVGWPKTSGSRGIHVNVRIEPRWTYPEVRRAALALARDVEQRVPALATSKWWKEERHGVFLDYNQNAKDRTVASAYSIRPLPDARVSTPLAWDEVPTVEAEAFTIDTVPPRYAAIGDPGDGIDDAVGSLEALLELSERHEAEGLGDAPWPPNYAKQAGEPPRVQPSRQRRAAGEYEPGRGEAGGPPPEVARARRDAVEQGDPNAGLPTEWAGSRPTPTGRRRTTIPVVEIARAEHKDEAMAGFERWKARHPAAAAALEPADVLVDSMRGRSTTWTRVRVNLIHVPEADRPGAGAARGRLRPMGRLRVARPAGAAGASAAQAEDGRRVMVRLVGVDHVQLSIPEGAEDRARGFYGEILGLREVAKPAALADRGGCWFAGPGVAIHLGVEPGFRPLAKAHPALLVCDLEAARGALTAAGVAIEEDDSGLPVRRCYVRDPFGNRIELVDERDSGFNER